MNWTIEKLNQLMENLKNSFVLTGSEVFYITEVKSLVSIYSFHHSTYLYTEIQLSVKGTSYHLKNSDIIKQKVNTIYFTVDNIEVLTANKSNLALLLLDECKLIRESAKDLYKLVS